MNRYLYRFYEAIVGNRIKSEDKECICKGNWRSIINKSEPLFGKKYKDRKGNLYTFVGVMHSEDDYYYVMSNETDTQFLSCVGNIEMFGYVLNNTGK